MRSQKKKIFSSPKATLVPSLKPKEKQKEAPFPFENQAVKTRENGRESSEISPNEKEEDASREKDPSAFTTPKKNEEQLKPSEAGLNERILRGIPHSLSLIGAIIHEGKNNVLIRIIKIKDFVSHAQCGNVAAKVTGSSLSTLGTVLMLIPPTFLVGLGLSGIGISTCLGSFCHKVSLEKEMDKQLKKEVSQLFAYIQELPKFISGLKIDRNPEIVSAKVLKILVDLQVLPLESVQNASKHLLMMLVHGIEFYFPCDVESRPFLDKVEIAIKEILSPKAKEKRTPKEKKRLFDPKKPEEEGENPEKVGMNGNVALRLKKPKSPDKFLEITQALGSLTFGLGLTMNIVETITTFSGEKTELVEKLEDFEEIIKDLLFKVFILGLIISTSTE